MGEEQITIKPIAHIKNCFPEKFGIPRQSGLVPEVRSEIIFEPEYRNSDALRGIDEYSHLWLIWQFSENLRDGWSPTVRPPRLGGNKRVGVFATRSPFRPNALGLSSVRLIRVEQRPGFGSILVVSGADLMDGTPIFDIKPYILYTDSHPDAVSSFADTFSEYHLDVQCSEKLLSVFNVDEKNALIRVLANDPRPSYQHDDTRIYCMSYGDYTVSFSVSGNKLVVSDIIFTEGEKSHGRNNP